MEIRLHANARTTPAVRAEIQASQEPVSVLARRFGVTEVTIRRWRRRSEVTDRSHARHDLGTCFAPEEEAIAVELRRSLWLSLDDALVVLRRTLMPDLSRSALYRCWRRHGVSTRPKKSDAQSSAPFTTDHPAGFIHVDVKHLPAIGRQRRYAYVAIDRATRFVYVEILDNLKGVTGAGFLTRFIRQFPLKVHTVLTDNGREFTDRFANDKKNKPKDQPSGSHPFDRACTAHDVCHRLTRPYRPQTNGMVERFNRRLNEAIADAPERHPNKNRKSRFKTQAERDVFITTFVDNYNRTRLRCLNYKAPVEVLYNLTEHNTFVGETDP